jgi:hypothetical protein
MDIGLAARYNSVMSNTATPPVLTVELPAPEPTKGEREYRAFLRLLPQLMQKHRGQHVAIHDEQVVDSDVDDVALILRVQAKFGYVPIHVGLVTDPLPVVRAPHYHEQRGQRDA